MRILEIDTDSSGSNSHFVAEELVKQLYTVISLLSFTALYTAIKSNNL